jgi:tRNA G46 methylase TrmB
MQPEFLAAVRRVLRPGGELLFMTDHEEYYEWTQEKAGLCGGFERLPWAEDTFFYPQTDFQKQWEDEGRAMFRLRLGKVARQPDAP